MTPTPKEKATELIQKVGFFAAMVVVDELLSFIEDDRTLFNWKKYYQEVSKEIENQALEVLK